MRSNAGSEDVSIVVHSSGQHLSVMVIRLFVHRTQNIDVNSARCASTTLEKRKATRLHANIILRSGAIGVEPNFPTRSCATSINVHAPAILGRCVDSVTSHFQVAMMRSCTKWHADRILRARRCRRCVWRAARRRNASSFPAERTLTAPRA
mmetsp:Transcript_36237/g.63847  ORF Transcript_36237/g.63847 Transcript_36237/m.63847 type:complete len:151 (-) Transcript_36237:1080-1532(-)